MPSASDVGGAVRGGMPSASDAAWYGRHKQVLPILTALGLAVQLSLSFKLAPRGSRSVTINGAYVAATVVIFAAAAVESHDYADWVLASVYPVTFVVTRGMRAAEIARGSAMNAARWLSLASDRPFTKAFGQMLLGFILTANSAGQPAGTRLGVMLVCEACRLGLVAQATLRAGCERRVFECAWLEATMGFGALAAGAALAAVIEGLISPEVLLAAIP